MIAIDYKFSSMLSSSPHNMFTVDNGYHHETSKKKLRSIFFRDTKIEASVHTTGDLIPLFTVATSKLLSLSGHRPLPCRCPLDLRSR